MVSQIIHFLNLSTKYTIHFHSHKMPSYIHIINICCTCSFHTFKYYITSPSINLFLMTYNNCNNIKFKDRTMNFTIKLKLWYNNLSHFNGQFLKLILNNYNCYIRVCVLATINNIAGKLKLWFCNGIITFSGSMINFLKLIFNEIYMMVYVLAKLNYCISTSPFYDSTILLNYLIVFFNS